MSLTVRTPLAGTVVAIEDVPDAVFSGKIVGPGLAVDPDRAEGATVTAVAPIAGRVSKVHPHAFVVVSPEGRGILVHLGLDTVELKGEGFAIHAVEGQDVAAGDPIVSWTPTEIEASGRNPVVPVVALDADESTLSPVSPGGSVEAGATVFTWT